MASPRDIILTSSAGGDVTAYDSLTGEALARFSGSRSPRKGLALAGTALIAASHLSASTASATVHLYSWCSSAPLHSIPLPEPVGPLAATSDGSHLFAGGLSGRVHALSLPASASTAADLHRSFRAHRQPISCLAVNDDGSLLISGGDDGEIAVFPILRLLDAAFEGGDGDRDGDEQLALYRIAAHELAVTDVAAGQGGCGASMVSTSLDGTCKLWSLADGECLRAVSFPCAMWCAAVDATSSSAYAGGADGRVYAIPLKAVARGRSGGGDAVAWAAAQVGAVTAVAMANGDANVVSATEEGVVTVWATESGAVVGVAGLEGSSGVSEVVVVAERRGGGRGGEVGRRSGGRSARAVGKQVREAAEMEEWAAAAAKERRRAVDTLEAAIATYEKLLRLLLREDKRCGRKDAAAKESNQPPHVNILSQST